MPEFQVQGKFYPLQNDEWLKACKSLTKSQLSVLYHLRSLDPYSNGIRVKASQIAKELEISKRAVNAAIAVLEEKGYINLEDVEYSVKLSAGGCFCDNHSTVTEVGREFPTQEENFPPEQEISHPSKEFPTQEENFPPEQGISHSQAETPTPQAVENSNIHKTFKIFKNSLSEEERKNFLEFGKKKASELPNPPTLPLKWVEKNWEEIAQEWYKSRGKTPTTHKWENDPRTPQWLTELEELKNPLAFFAPGDKLDKEKQAFTRWAEENKLVSWRR